MQPQVAAVIGLIRENALEVLRSLSREDLERSDASGRSPLHLAVMKMNIGAMEVILSKITQEWIDVKDSHGDTPLMYACRWDRPEVRFPQTPDALVTLTNGIPHFSRTARSVAPESPSQPFLKK